MAIVFKDRAKELSTATGASALDLDGAASGYLALPTATSFYYCVAQQDGSEWEVGRGIVVVETPNYLSREAVLQNHLGTTDTVMFSAGTKDVFCVSPAAFLESIQAMSEASPNRAYAYAAETTTDATPLPSTLTFVPAIPAEGGIRYMVVKYTVAASVAGGGNVKAWEGRIVILDAAVDSSTKTVLLDTGTTAWDISFGISGANIVITVTGAAATELYWKMAGTVEISTATGI